MSAKFKFLFVICLFLSVLNTHAQTPAIRNNYQTEAGVQKLNIERSMIYSPDKEWLYNHHASIIHFKDRFVAIWSNGMIDEDSPGQRVVYAISKDFKHWSPLKH